MNLHDPDAGKAKKLSRDRQLRKALERAIEHQLANTETMFAATFTIVFNWLGHDRAVQLTSAQLHAIADWTGGEQLIGLKSVGLRLGGNLD